MKRSYKFKSKKNNFRKRESRFDLEPETKRGIWAIGLFVMTVILALS